MRHNAFGPVDFFHDTARVWGDLLVQYQTIFLTSNQRLRQINGIVNDIEPGQNVTAPYPVGGYGRQVAVLDTIPPKIFFFDVRGRYFQRVAFPLPGGEAAPSVCCVVRGTRTPVQVNGIVNGT
ncbi:MAG: hypothetical protein DMG13_19000 [Acidobacteria bacterium]|nr:MAG: hypothetical protein DMG13_19000 [Acidobacteriota bacterium]